MGKTKKNKAEAIRRAIRRAQKEADRGWGADTDEKDQGSSSRKDTELWTR